MPVAALVCPHCEKPVELQVTAVTRSRRCPHCSKHIMLQFAQKQGLVKRKALLVNTTGGLDFDALKNEAGIEEPQPLIGDAFDRMKSDPELVAIKRRFAWSIGVVAALVLVATIFHLNRDRWFPEIKKPALQPMADSGAPVSSSLLTKGSMIANARRPEKKPEQLNFTSPDSPAPAATSSSKPQNATANAPPRIGPGNSIPGVSLSQLSQGGNAAPPPTKQGISVIGELPKSLLRVARSGPSVQVNHDLNMAKAALAGFLKAETVEERMNFVAYRARIESHARAYYLKNGDAPVAFRRIADAEVVGNGMVSEHNVVLADGRVWTASVIKISDGNYLVDWPSFVAEGEMEWLDLMEKKVQQPVMLRVAAEAGNFFGGDFSDSKWLLCVKLVHPVNLGAPPIFAYVERQSVLGREMDYWLKFGEKNAIPMTVRVKYPPTSSTDNQVWLSEIVAPGWLVRTGQPVVEAKGHSGQLPK